MLLSIQYLWVGDSHSHVRLRACAPGGGTTQTDTTNRNTEQRGGAIEYRVSDELI